MTYMPQIMLAAGAISLCRISCAVMRTLGILFVTCALLLIATPAFADETVHAVDDGEVLCNASRSDLTRISLRDDQFASVSRVENGAPGQDITIVHEPTRGDIYLSVPEGYTKETISFFGTSQKGFVYKFSCRITMNQAHQVFVVNADMANPQRPAEQIAAGASLNDSSVTLVRAMFEQRPVSGFEIRDIARAPVNIGDLKVQLVSEYRGAALMGKVLRVENRGTSPVVLNEALVAGEGAVAVSIANPELQPGQATSAYIVIPAGVL
jgi:conjugal transfer pilus assembly protein TraK